MINGYPLAAAALCLVLAFARWKYGKKHKPPFWLLTIAGFLASLGVPAWYHAVADLVHDKAGLFAVSAITLGAGLVFWHEGVRNRGRHHIRTPIVGLVFGQALLVTVASFSRIMRQAGNMPAGTSHALAQAVTSINSAHAGKLGAAHDLPVVVAGLAVIAVLAFVAHRLARGNSSTSSGRGGPARRPGGSSSGREIARRPPAPVGRRK